MKNSKLFWGICYFVLIYNLFPQKAYAYLDPGTGSYVFQIIAATFIGAVFSIKVFWRNIKLFFAGLLAKKEDHGNNTEKTK